MGKLAVATLVALSLGQPTAPDTALQSREAEDHRR